MIRLSVAFNAHSATNSWNEIFTIPSGYSGAENISKNTFTKEGKTAQFRVEGDKVYINLLQAVAADDLLSDQMIYLKS